MKNEPVFRRQSCFICLKKFYPYYCDICKKKNYDFCEHHHKKGQAHKNMQRALRRVV